MKKEEKKKGKGMVSDKKREERENKELEKNRKDKGTKEAEKQKKNVLKGQFTYSTLGLNFG